MRSWLIATGVLVVTVVLGVLARQTPLLRGWGQPVVSVVVMLFLYWYGWEGHADERYRGLRLRAPVWLSYLCLRPGENRVSILVFLQVGALGYLVGVLKGLTRNPALMRGYGILCCTLAVGLVLILWGLWAAYGTVMRAFRRL